jgi:hypothetical protein
MKTYTITDRISGTIVATVRGDDDYFPIYDTGDTFGLLGFDVAEVAEFLGTENFELVVTRGEVFEV